MARLKKLQLELIIQFRRRNTEGKVDTRPRKKECVVGRTRVSESFYKEEEEAAVNNERGTARKKTGRSARQRPRYECIGYCFCLLDEGITFIGKFRPMWIAKDLQQALLRRSFMPGSIRSGGDTHTVDQRREREYPGYDEAGMEHSHSADTLPLVTLNLF
jgi:hypothetical protein